LLEKHHIPAAVFIIVGYPGETLEIFSASLAFYKKIRKVKPDLNFHFFLPQPYPGTKLFERCVKEGWLPADYFSSISDIKLMTTDKLWIETPDFDQKEIQRRMKILHKLFRPKRSLKRRIYEASPVFVTRGYQHIKSRLKNTGPR
jgi:radical SAM superfamily enzyme YgiQ (UPF0313 family)